MELHPETGNPRSKFVHSLYTQYDSMCMNHIGQVTVDDMKIKSPEKP